MKRLLVIRGKPGSGKSSVARILQKCLLPEKVAIFTPDYFYWKVFPGEDNKHLVNVVLNHNIKRYLKENYFVILEGILPQSENSDLFDWLHKYCRQKEISLHSIYLDVSLKKALNRNKHRIKGKEISAKDLKQWYKNSIAYEIGGEFIIDTNKLSAEEVAKKIFDLLRVK